MHAQRTALEAFVQDTWKIRRRLTLDYGLRLYWTPPIVDRDDIMSGFVLSRFDPARQPLLIRPGFDAQRRRIGVDPRNGEPYPAAAIGAIAPGSGDLFNGMVSTLLDRTYPRGLTTDPGVQLGPRFGFAYDITGKSRDVIRGGFGVFYNREVMANAFKFLVAQPPNVVTPILHPRVWNYGLASFDRTHVFTMNYLYTLPRTRSQFPVARILLDGWQLSGITRFISGTPMTVNLTTTTGMDITGSPSLSPRVLLTGNPVLPKSERSFDRYFRTEVIHLPPVGSVGNAAKYILRGPGINSWDISVFRNFRVRERLNTQWRCEAYNAFNHTQFSGVNVTARFDPAGNQTNTALGQYNAARRPRYIQLALRFSF